MTNNVPFSSSSIISPRRIGQSCSSHTSKRGELYCLMCELVICSECLIGSRKHFRHPVETVKHVYAARFRKTQSDLESLNQHIESLCKDVKDQFSKLENIQRQEDSVLQRLDQFMADAKLQVTEKSRNYTKQLEPFVLTTQLKRHNRDQLLTKIASLSEGEFLAQQAEIDKQIEGMARSVGKVPELYDINENIACLLIPTILMRIHELEVDERWVLSFSHVDRYGIRWEIQLKRAKYLLLIETSELEALEGNFLLDLEILNILPLKNIQMKLPFKLPDASSRQISKVLTMDFSQLQNKGFIEKDNLLRIKCGIGPVDPVTERNCYELAVSKCRNKIRSLREELVELKNFNIGHFIMTKCYPSGSKQCAMKHSLKISDSNGVFWQLQVMINGKQNQGFVGICLIKCSAGYAGWYDYFIKLVHLQSEQKNRIVKGSVFFEKDPCLRLDLPQFMAITFMDQFWHNGTLHFRYGTSLEK